MDDRSERAGKTTVLVVDDHQTFADLLEGAIGRQPDMVCVGTAHSVASALAMVRSEPPDVVVMDYQLGDGDGISATAHITEHHPDVRVVLLTAHPDESLLKQAARVGACCLLTKSGSLPELLAAVRTASPQGLVVQPSLLKSLVSARREQVAVPSLSPREDDVLQLLSGGSDVRSAAKALGISTSTCRSYVRGLLTKLDAHSQLEAVAAAHRLGLTRAGYSRPA